MIPLSEIASGTARCHSIQGEGAEVVRLKRLGICSGHDIQVLQAGDPMIVQVIGTKVGVSRQLAHRVLVEQDAMVSERVEDQTP